MNDTDDFSSVEMRMPIRSTGFAYAIKTDFRGDIMKSLHLTAHISTDGMLHLPVAEFADQDVEVIVLPVVSRPAPSNLLYGQEALQKARDIGFIGSFEAEPDFSVRYNEALDWSSKT